MKEKKIQFFAQDTNRFYQLFPTKTIPTLKISAVPMHRYVHTDPLTDTKSKIMMLRPSGIVLDTCTGLGYTAIYSAKKHEVIKVITAEKDVNVLMMAEINDASKELFENQKIEIVLADVSEMIKEFPSCSFNCILHDPPTFVMAPELYNIEFYKELYRVLRNKGRLWHYCPAPGKLKGRRPLREKVALLLKRTGFRNVRYDEASSGIISEK